MRLLAIDPDTQWAWWALFEDGKLVVEFDRLKCAGEDRQVSWEWKTLLVRFHPDHVVVEFQHEPPCRLADAIGIGLWWDRRRGGGVSFGRRGPGAEP